MWFGHVMRAKGTLANSFLIAMKGKITRNASRTVVRKRVNRVVPAD